MANNIAFQPMGKTYQVTASNVAANTITVTANTPSNQYLVISHEKTGGTGHPVYIRISATSANAAVPDGNGQYGIPIPPGTVVVFISPVEFGKLINAVETLTFEVESLRSEVKTMKEQMTGARGVAVGLMLAAGGVGAGASHLFERMFK